MTQRKEAWLISAWIEAFTGIMFQRTAVSGITIV